MLQNRFGRKIKLPSTAAIKHQIMRLMLADLLKAKSLEAQNQNAGDKVADKSD
jgi:hypothetical protein